MMKVSRLYFLIVFLIGICCHAAVVDSGKKLIIDSALWLFFLVVAAFMEANGMAIVKDDK